MPQDLEIPPRWTEQQVRECLKEFPATSYNVKLPYGLETGGVNCSETVEKILGADMTGKSLLDIACANGLFCFEALKRGAARSKGIEIDAATVRQSRHLAECLGLDAEFAQEDIDAIDVTDRFDYVLCMNILQHMKNPFSVLEKLIAITRDKLVIELATPGRHDRKKLGIGWIEAFYLRKAPVVLVDHNGRGRTGQKYFISPKALENMLLRHRRVFANVTIDKSPHKDRFIITASKRRIRRLLVIAGPTSVGKTTFIERLRSGELGEIERELGFHDLGNWVSETAGSLIHQKQACIDSMIFHYDFMHVHFRSERTPARDTRLDVLNVAEEVIFITLTAPRDVLLKRIHASEIDPKSAGGGSGGNTRHEVIRDIYQRPGGVYPHYRGWFDFIKTKSLRQYVVDTSRNYQLLPLADWESKRGSSLHA